MIGLSRGQALTPASFWRSGVFVLWAGLALGLLVLFGLVWRAPQLLPALPAVLLAGAGIVYLVRHPFLHLCLVLAGSALILKHEPGIQVAEVIYGLYVVFYLGQWFVSEVYLKRTRPFASKEAKALLAVLLIVVVLLPLSFFLGATLRTVGRELIALVMLALFFPIREAIAQHRNAARVLFLIAVGLCVFVVIRNLLTYQSLLNNADKLAELAEGRVITNDHVLAASSLVAFVFLLHAESLKKALLYLAFFLLYFGGLILTLSRGFWIAFAWGVLFLLVVVEWKYRARILLYGASGVAAVFIIGYAFLGDLVAVFLAGIIDRVTSIAEATTTDISMLGRYQETRAALRALMDTPILGHGIGVPYRFYNIVDRLTIESTFMHNGYVSLWYRFGMIGFGLMLYWWGRAIWLGLKAYRMRSAPLELRLIALGAAAALTAFTLSAITSNPFYHKDYLLGFGFLTALAYGIYARQHADASTAELPERST